MVEEPGASTGGIDVPPVDDASNADRPAAPILVEFEGAGYREVARSVDDLARESAQALEKAMGTIREMGARVTATIDSMAKRPRQVEVTFGIKLDAEAGAVIAKVGGGTYFDVKLVWEHGQRGERDSG